MSVSRKSLTGAELKSRERVQMDLMMLSAQGYINKALEPAVSLKRDSLKFFIQCETHVV